jgi:hypothetical protein
MRWRRSATIVRQRRVSATSPSISPRRGGTERQQTLRIAPPKWTAVEPGKQIPRFHPRFRWNTSARKRIITGDERLHARIRDSVAHDAAHLALSLIASGLLNGAALCIHIW